MANVSRINPTKKGSPILSGNEHPNADKKYEEFMQKHTVIRKPEPMIPEFFRMKEDKDGSRPNSE